MKPLKKVYLAGPDVFRPDAVEAGMRLKQLCLEHGIQGLYPFDNLLPPELSPEKASDYIFKANVKQLISADALLVNLNHFRGFEPDSGTVYELAMAYTLGKPVWVYFEPKGEMVDYIPHVDKVDSEGNAVEDFGLARNLMLAHSWVGYSKTAEQAIVDLAAFLKSNSGDSVSQYDNELFVSFESLVEGMPSKQD